MGKLLNCEKIKKNDKILHWTDFLSLHFSSQIYEGSFNQVPTCKLT